MCSGSAPGNPNECTGVSPGAIVPAKTNVAEVLVPEPDGVVGVLLQPAAVSTAAQTINERNRIQSNRITVDFDGRKRQTAGLYLTFLK
jgi:hypothetical protein